MSHLLFTLEDQRINRMDAFYPVEKSVNYLKAKFELLSEEWQGKSITAVFNKDGVTKYAILDDNNECFVPHEILASHGFMHVSAFCGDNEFVTANAADVYIFETGYEPGEEEDNPPSPSAYDEMLSYFNDSRQVVRADKEFVEEQVENLKHMHGGKTSSADWTGVESDDDPQNTTIQNRTGLEEEYDSEKQLPGEIVATSRPSTVHVKFEDGSTDTLVLGTTLNNLQTIVDGLIADKEILADNIDQLTSRVDSHDDEIARSFNDAYLSDDGLLSFMHDDVVLKENMGPFAGGGGGTGGGGGGAYSRISFTNLNPDGWVSMAVTDEQVVFIFSYTSLDIDSGAPTGAAAMKLYRGVDILEQRQAVPQSTPIALDVTKYLNPGTNDFSIAITDINGVSRRMPFSVTKATLTVASSFQNNTVYPSAITVPVTVTGTGTKTLVAELDGDEFYTATVTANSRQLTVSIPSQSHGVHVLRIWATSEVSGLTVQSNELYYELTCIDTTSDDVLIASAYKNTEERQYSVLSIPFYVYSPTSYISDVDVYVNGELATSMRADRTEQTFTYRLYEKGELNIEIRCGRVSKEFKIDVVDSGINVAAEDAALALFLSSMGRSNSEIHPERWVYGDYSVQFSGMSWGSTDGWHLDAKGIPALRLQGDARATVGYTPFASNFKSSGWSMELEFTTFNVRDVNTKVVNCFIADNEPGFYMTPNTFFFRSQKNSVKTNFKDGEHITIAVTVSQANETDGRLMHLYINGIPSGCVRYDVDDNFLQSNPLNILLGSSDCGIDIYKIRVYNQCLTANAVKNNYIADEQDLDTMIARYHFEDIYDDEGNIDPDKLPDNLPRLIIYCDEIVKNARDAYGAPLPMSWEPIPDLPEIADDSRTVDMIFRWPVRLDMEFDATGVKLKPQGTSSLEYYRKNYKADFTNGFIMRQTGETISKYQIRQNSVPVKKFVFKADVASCEGANNVEVVRYYCDICPGKTPPQLAEALKEASEQRDIRQGIDGFGMVIFWATAPGEPAHFLGKYNFNNDKGTEEVYGFGYSEFDESYEIRNNTGGRVLFQDGVATSWDNVETWLSDKNEKADFEMRYPKQPVNLQYFEDMIDWVRSTDIVTPQLSAEEKAVIGCTAENLTPEEVEARKTKFKNEFEDWFDLELMTFYWVYTETFLLSDNRAKNGFPTHFGQNGKWFWLPYDFDTCLGINNQGGMIFPPYTEYFDFIGGSPAFTGYKSTLWINFVREFYDNCKDMYASLRNSGKLSYDRFMNMFLGHQEIYPIGIWAADEYAKYLDPLLRPRPNDDGLLLPTEKYLAMILGSKAEHTKYWFSERLRFLDSKFQCGNSATEQITFRAYQKANVTLTAFKPVYPTVKIGTYYTQIDRLQANETGTVTVELSTLANTECAIQSASSWRSIGDMSKFKPGTVDVHYATNLEYLKLGDSQIENGEETYFNDNLCNDDNERITIGALKKLRGLDIRNCRRVRVGVDLSGCDAIEEVLAEGTNTTGITFPTGGNLQTVHLPASVNTLILCNHPNITDFQIGGWENMRTLWLEGLNDPDNLENGPINIQQIYNVVPANCALHLAGFEWTATSVAEINAWLAAMDQHHGLVLEGNDVVEVDDVQLECTINIDTITGAEYAAIKMGHPGVTIRYNTITSQLRFWDFDGSGTAQGEPLATVSVVNAADAEVPPYLVNPERPDTAQYDYTFEGWSTKMNQEVVDPDALKAVELDRDIYAVYSKVVREYSVTFVSNGRTLQIVENVPYGGSATYTSPVVPTDPSGEGKAFWKWNPDNAETVGSSTGVTNVVGNTTATAQFEHNYTVNFYLDEAETTLLSTMKVLQGRPAVYDGVPNPPVSPNGAEFLHWDAESEMAAVWSDLNVHAVFEALYEVRFVVMTDQGEQHLKTVSNIPDGGSASYGSSYPVDPSGNGAAFLRWEPAPTNIHANTTCVAVFESMYTVYFYNGDELLATVPNVHYGDDVTYPLSTVPTMPNKKFNGWSPAPLDIRGDTYCFATWQDTYTVTWYVGNNKVYEVTGIEANHLVRYNGPDVSEMGTDGADFLGWDVPGDSITVTRNMIIHALFEEVYTVTFEDYDGTYLDQVRGVKSGGRATYPGASDPVRNGYRFTGWNPEPTGITSDTTVRATYVKLYKVEFYANGNKIGEVQDIPEHGSATFTGSVPNNAESGATWNGGWDPMPVNVTEDMQCYATYGTAYVVTFMANGVKVGEVKGVAPNTTVEYDGSNLTGAHGARFVRWNPAPVVVDSNLTCTAVFETMYQVTFLDENNDPLQTQWVPAGTPCVFDTSSNPLPTKENYDFIGWNPDPAEAGGVSGTMTCYPQFRIKETYLWQTLGNAIADGTYSSKYHVKDTIPYTIAGVGTFDAVIMGINKDKDVLGNTVPITFTTRQNYGATQMTDADTISANQWKTSKLRTVTLPAILEQMPDYVAKYITPVRKLSLANAGASDVETYDKLFVPSVYELIGNSNGSEGPDGRVFNREIGDVVYDQYFISNADMIRYNKSTSLAEVYWTRSANTVTELDDPNRYNGYQGIATVGGIGGAYAGDATLGVNICFAVTTEALATENTEAANDIPF